MSTSTHPELMLISAVLRTGDHITPIHSGMTFHMFHTYREEWKWIERYINKNRRTPSKAAFRGHFPKVRLMKTDDVDHFIDEVRKSHARFELIRQMDEMAEQLNDGEDPLKLIASQHTDLVSLQAAVIGKAAELDLVNDWQFVFDDVMRRVERVRKQGLSGVKTGFDTLDEETGGPQPGDYWVVAARLGEGKTWTMLRMAIAAYLAGAKVQFLSLEQSRTQIGIRAHTFLSKILQGDSFRHLDLSQGRNFSLREYKKFLESLSQHTGGSLFITDSSNGQLSPMTIAGVIERNRPDIVFIDYITLIDVPGDDWKATAKLSHEIKWLAQKYQVPIVVAAQINRMGVGKEPPNAEHLSQSDAIGHDADCIVTIKQMSTHVSKLKIAKFRNGKGGHMWWVKFNPNNGEMEEVSQNEAQNLIEVDKAANLAALNP